MSNYTLYTPGCSKSKHKFSKRQSFRSFSSISYTPLQDDGIKSRCKLERTLPSIRFTFAAILSDTVAWQNLYSCNLVLVYGRVFCHAERARFYALTHSARTGILAENSHIREFVDETAMSFHVTSAATVTVVTKIYKVSVTIRSRERERERKFERDSREIEVDVSTRYSNLPSTTSWRIPRYEIVSSTCLRNAPIKLSSTFPSLSLIPSLFVCLEVTCVKSNGS